MPFGGYYLEYSRSGFSWTKSCRSSASIPVRDILEGRHENDG